MWNDGRMDGWTDPFGNMWPYSITTVCFAICDIKSSSAVTLTGMFPELELNC